MLNLLRIWLGASDTDVETVFRWMDGSILSWVNWEAGYPSGVSGLSFESDCIARLGTGGKWADHNCNETRKFYCETTEGRCRQFEDRIILSSTVTLAIIF